MVREEEKKGGFLKSILPIIGLIILGGLAWLLLRGCQDKPAPVAAPAQNADETAAAPASTTAADATPATLNIAVDETGNAVYSAVVKQVLKVCLVLSVLRSRAYSALISVH